MGDVPRSHGWDPCPRLALPVSLQASAAAPPHPTARSSRGLQISGSFPLVWSLFSLAFLSAWNKPQLALGLVLGKRDRVCAPSSVVYQPPPPTPSQCHKEGSETSLVAQAVELSTYSAGDLGLTPGSGRSPGEGNGILAHPHPPTKKKIEAQQNSTFK